MATKTVLAVTMLMSSMTGCGVSVIRSEPPPPPTMFMLESEAPLSEADRELTRAMVAHVKIPPEYLPPPGKCRVWHPERLPTQQPPASACSEILRYRVPAGALLVRG